METPKSNVYIRIDSDHRILAVNGGYTTPADLTGWTMVDEGYGDKYNLCQSNYLPSPIMTEDGIPRWKYYRKKCTLRSDAEIDADRAAAPKPPLSEVEKLRKQIGAQNEILDFYESCIAEMAEIVYA